MSQHAGFTHGQAKYPYNMAAAFPQGQVTQEEERP
jgi:hypothetical protein